MILEDEGTMTTDDLRSAEIVRSEPFRYRGSPNSSLGMSAAAIVSMYPPAVSLSWTLIGRVPDVLLRIEPGSVGPLAGRVPAESSRSKRES